MTLIKKIKLKDIESYTNSAEFLSMVNTPISLLRVNSYIHNPKADIDDTVLYMAYDRDKLVAYRTILSDVIYLNDKQIKFGWLSGNWVHNNYRRRGISTLLFNEVYKDWDKKLLYTNYAIESKKLYDKTEQFKELKIKTGYRFYLRFCLKDLLPVKSIFFERIKNVLGVVDGVFNTVFDLRFQFQNKNKKKYFEKLCDWDTETIHFLEKFKQKELFKRDKNDYQWIFNYPWVKSDIVTRENSKTYFFSSYASIFNSSFYKILDRENNKLIGVVLLTIRDKTLKMPYAYITPEAIEKTTDLILDLCKKHKINYLTTFHVAINDLLLKKRASFLMSKKFEQKYFITKSLIDSYPKIREFEIQSGDGDVVFT